MRRLGCMSIGVVCLVLAGGCGKFTPGATSEGLKRDTSLPRVEPNFVPGGFVLDNNRFAFDLYAKVSTSPGNLFFSPHSISTTLAMTYAGADGTTRDQMRTVLHFSGLDTALHQQFAELLAALSKENNAWTILRPANRIWAQAGMSFEQPFLDVIRNQYGADVETLDFASSPGNASTVINGWVAQATGHKIPEIIEPEMITADTVMLLVNALYFKGQWAEVFKADRTQQAPFYSTGGNRDECMLMNQYGKKRYYENEEVQAVELPYMGALSMVIVLPRAVDGLARLEESLTADDCMNWVAGMGLRDVDLFLPRFQMRWRCQLNDVLSEMGMLQALAGEANFTRMHAEGGICISDVLHEAVIEVNEEGTEAAAATGVLMRRGRGEESEGPVLVRADHPFLFFIRERRAGSILFLGRMLNPA